MRVAVVTPVGPAHHEEIERCMASVAAQKVQQRGGLEIHHVLVHDGPRAPETKRNGAVVCHAFGLASGASNAGATPRAIGSAYAMGALKADVLAYLDADNTLDPNHLAVALEHAAAGKEVIASRRLICHHETGEPMFVDEESDGERFADTNTLVLAGRAAKFGQTFDWPGPYEQKCAETGADRVFWERLKRSFDRTRICTGMPTVMYRSTWLAHYLPGHEPPPVCKVMIADKRGTRKVTRVRPTQLWLQHPEDGTWRRPLGIEDGNVQLEEIPHDDDGLLKFGSRGWEVEESNG